MTEHAAHGRKGVITEPPPLAPDEYSPANCLTEAEFVDAGHRLREDRACRAEREDGERRGEGRFAQPGENIQGGHLSKSFLN